MEYTASLQDPSITSASIRRSAISLEKETAKAGVLFRQSAVLKVWKERYVVVGKDSLMYWYGSKDDLVPEDVIYLKKATGVRREEVAGRSNTFIVTSKNVEKILGFANPLAPKVSIYPFSATDSEQMESWLRVIGKAIVSATTTEWDETSDRIAEQQQET
mmetsp:Transcript_19077/g.48006  ORF Transcript_19077/g.48006 Transcript_19077/m.48006 type:complete len:160 (+) Transcript_19077:166-645(+)